MKQNLYESLDINTVRYAKLWESIGYSITEAELAPNQITDLFKNIQAQATSTGANRTVLGKGVDITRKVNAAFAKIKEELADTDEVKNFEAKYDDLAKKLKDATGGDQGVARYVNAYRAFATKHPVVQKVIYSVLVAGLGIAAGTGGLSATGTGATVLGLLKMTDRLLQGDKATSAIWKGFKTGAAGYAAGQIGKGIKHVVGHSDTVSHTTDSASNIADSDEALDKLRELAKNGKIKDWNSYQQALKFVTKGHNSYISQEELNLEVKGEVADASSGSVNGSGPALIKRWVELQGGDASGFNKDISDVDTIRKQMNNESLTASVKGVKLTEAQIMTLLTVAEATIANKAKALGSKIGSKLASTGRNVASAVGKKASDFGTQLTTKFTEKKLQAIWKQTGSPTDSDDIYKILINIGVPLELIDKVYNDSKIPLPGFRSNDIVNTENDNLDEIINKILHTHGKDAAIAYLQKMKQEKSSPTK